MLRPEKIDVVAEIKDRIAHHEISILARYIGITVEQVTLLRKKLREQGIVLKVYKNTLAKRALDELGLSEAVRFIEGPTAWAFSKDPVAPAKVLKDFAKDVEAVGMSGGILSGRIVTKEQLVCQCHHSIVVIIPVGVFSICPLSVSSFHYGS